MNTESFIYGARCRRCQAVTDDEDALRCPDCKSYNIRPVLICPRCDNPARIYAKEAAAIEHADMHNHTDYADRLREGTAPIGEWAMRLEK